MAVGLNEVLKAWLKDEGCKATFKTIAGSPTILMIEKKDGKESWFKWSNIVEAWNNGLSACAIAKRIAVCGTGKQEI